MSHISSCGSVHASEDLVRDRASLRGGGSLGCVGLEAPGANTYKEWEPGRPRGSPPAALVS